MLRKHQYLFNTSAESGGMLVELMLSVALAMLVIPFIFKYHQNAIARAENVAVTRRMQHVGSALERYITENREQLMSTIGKNITRVELSDLGEYGIDEDLIATDADRYQLRILKSADINDRATLQGVIILSDTDISPIRTRQIVNIGGADMGFVDDGRAYGAYGAWHTDAVSLGIGGNSGGIIKTTDAVRDNAKYLWRVPSGDPADATMLSALSMGGHDILDASFFNGRDMRFEETMAVGKIVSNNITFQNRTSIDNIFNANMTTVAGGLSADSKNMDVTGNFSLADTGKFSNFTVTDLYVTNMRLAGLSISDTEKVALLKINGGLDMTYGRITAMYVTVGFAGSITPRLDVKSRIEDSNNSAYYWDVSGGTANMVDASFAELTRMAPMALAQFESGTDSARIFGAVAANKNATASDYMNAITQIQETVRKKYRRLNL
ncbi:hypothetical protein HDR61_02395 [bacterium]|nr:hypothetical protein [bacterium]